jgi:hypothetical protein
MEHWLVLSNCQTQGLTNCLGLLYPDAEVEACDIWQLRHEIDQWSKAIPAYDRVFLNVEVGQLGLFDFSGLQNVVRIPTLEFYAYHPDLCCVWVNNLPIKSPLDDYHSAIAVAAYKKGLDEKAACALFNGGFYAAAGFFGLWERSRSEMLGTFMHYGFDLAGPFRRWTQRRPFMHAVNHPRIECLWDIATLAVAKAGREPVVSVVRPHDNLIVSSIYPVFEELAEHLGVEGTNLFKPLGKFRLIPLDDFVAKSFEVYRMYAPDELVPGIITADRFQAIMDAI